MNPKIKAIESVSNHKMIIAFSNDEVKEFDFSPYLHYPVFAQLNNETFFKKAIVYNGTIVWNEEVDFDPDTLYLESKTIVLRN